MQSAGNARWSFWSARWSAARSVWWGSAEDALPDAVLTRCDLQSAQRRQLVQLADAQARLEAARRRVADLQEALTAAHERIFTLTAALGQKQQQVAAAQAALKATRESTHRERTTHMELQVGRCGRQPERSLRLFTSPLAHSCFFLLPPPLQGHTFLRSLDTVCREQRHRVVRRALEIFPLVLVPPMQAPARRGSSGGARGAAAPSREERFQAMICSLLLPDSSDGPAELAALGSQLGSALGYVALLLDVLSRFLLLPATHRVGFKGAASCTWQPDSWWDMRPGPPPDARALPLFWAPPKQVGTGQGAATAVVGLSETMNR